MSLNGYYLSQWKQPIRIGPIWFRLCIWKWCAVWFPIWIIFVGKNNNYFGYTIFHNGHGFELYFPRIIVFRLCIKGKIGWWYKMGIVDFHLFNYFKFSL